MPRRSTLPSWQGGGNCWRHQGITVALPSHPALSHPAHRDMVLLGGVCHLLWLQELGSGWTAPTECGQDGGAEGAESSVWTHLGTLVGVLLLFPKAQMCLPSKIFSCPTDCTCGSSGLDLRFLS